MISDPENGIRNILDEIFLAKFSNLEKNEKPILKLKFRYVRGKDEKN